MNRLSSSLATALILAGLSACNSDTPPAPVSTPPAVAEAEEVTLVAACNSCHGDDGVGTDPDVPFIAGLHAQYLESAMRAYLIGDRQHKIMRAAVFDLESSERHQLAEHFAKLKTPWQHRSRRTTRSGSSDQQRDARAGQALARPCAGCHGADGNSVKSGVPSLAGLQPAYFVPALKSYLQGQRQGASIMKNFKLSLNEREIEQLAAYFATQKRKRSPLGGKLNPAQASDALAHRCLGCHGADGNSTHPAIPSLAGQNAEYLIKAMQTYRDNKRQNRMMTDVAHGLSDEAIRGNAIYFATRTPLAMATASHRSPTAATGAFDPLGDGKRLAASCNGCHGENGNSRTPGTPSLAGQKEAYLRTAITHYRDGERKHAMMQMLTRYLSETDIEKLALYYASQTPVSRTTTTTAETQQTDAATQELVGGCAGCHGEGGIPETGEIPSLAGQNANYLVAALNAYKTGTRPHSDMKGAAEKLNKKAMQNLAQYYSRLAPKGSAVHTMEAPALLAQKCDRCHGENGNKPDADKPRIAGQRRGYLINALIAYKNKQRINELMNAMAANLSRVEIEAIASYYEKQ